MKLNVDRSATTVLGASYTRNAVARTAERIQGWFRRPDQEPGGREIDLRLQDERLKERARIARELHDTVLQGFLGASMLLQSAVDEVPADSPGRPSLCNALRLLRRVIDEGHDAINGLRSTAVACLTLEQALLGLEEELKPCGVRLKFFVTGRTRSLEPAVQEQVYLIVREALVNALRHSKATSVEAEVEYLPRRVRVSVRDNGCGIDPKAVWSARDGHWGILGMRERAGTIGAQLKIWSRPGAGTEVEVSVPDTTVVDALSDALARTLNPETNSSGGRVMSRAAVSC